MHRRPSHRGFTLLEALVSIAVAVTASSALFLGLYGNLQNTQATLEQLAAQGIAEQVVDEVLGSLYVSDGATSPLSGIRSATSWEQAGEGRERYNDTDDYHGFAAEPPEDPFGVRLGSGDGAGGLRQANFRVPAEYLGRWKQEITISYVRDDNPQTTVSAAPWSSTRAVEVRITRREASGVYRELAKVRRVFGYVPSSVGS